MRYLLILLIGFVSLFANDAFISPSKLKSYLKNDNLIIIDVSDYQIYKKSHIKGAIHSDISDFIDKESPYHLSNPPQDIQDEIQALGIDTNSHVVIYAHNTKKGILNSSYLAFILTNSGFENISILNGGYLSWVFQHEFLTSTEILAPDDGTFIVKDNNNSLISVNSLKNSHVSSTIIDARSPQAYYGVIRSDGLITDGHIPNAKNSFYSYNFLADSTLRKQKELDEIYIDGHELKKDDNIIVYGDNIFSATMEFYILYNHMGFKNTKLYGAGLLEWSRDLKLPMTRFKWE